MTTELVDSFFVVDPLNKWKHMKTWKNNISRYSLLYLLTKVCSAQATSVREAPPIAPGFRLLTMLSCPNRAPIPIRVFLYSHQSPHCIPDATSATRLSNLATKVGLFAITSLGKFAFYVSGCFWILCDVECHGVKHALIWRHRMASTARATDCTSCIQTNYIISADPSLRGSAPRSLVSKFLGLAACTLPSFSVHNAGGFCLVACRLPVFLFLFSGFQRQRFGNFSGCSFAMA